MSGAHLHAVLDDGRSYARLSTEPEAQTCIVFVHGFWGNVNKTWADFPDLCDIAGVPGADLLKNADLYFFDYPAEKAFVKVGAARLARFMNRIFPLPEMALFRFDEIDRGSIRAPWLPYQRVLLVGHSLGAVIIRECVANEFKQFERKTSSWADCCEVRLFASAQIGFKLAGWPAVLSAALPQIVMSLPSFLRAYNDLQSGSYALTDLKRSTEALASSHPNMMCLRALLLYGEEEQVVTPGGFQCDFAIEFLEKLNHQQVCKPSKNFTEPLRFVTYHAFRDKASA